MKSLQTICLLFASAGLVAAQQYTISTVAGLAGAQGLFPFIGDGTPTLATAGYLYQPSTLSIDSAGNFYISDYFSNAIRKVTLSTGNITTIAGTGTPGFAGDGDPANQAKIGPVHGIAADSSGNVYFSDTSNSRIRKIDSKSGNISTFAGTGNRGYAGDGGTADHADLWYPGAMVLDSSGNLYFTDYGSYTVRKITSSGTISTIAGTGVWGNAGDGGAASKATLASPVSLAFDKTGNLYIGDVGNRNIRKIDSAGNISTVVTNVTPQSLAIDAAGNFYYVDSLTSVVRKILPGGGVVAIAGTGVPGYNGTDGSASLLEVFNPGAISVAPDGSIYFADTGNNLVRRLAAVTGSLGVQDGASQLPNAIAPGEILTLFGSGLGPAQLTSFTVGTNGLFPTQIAGTSVKFNGIAAPMIYTSSGTVSVIAPYEIANSGTANIVVTFQGSTFSTSVPVTDRAPSLFTADSSGRGQAAALNQNLSANSASNPAKPGSTIILYATGEGYTTSPVNGKVAGTNPPSPVIPISVKIGNQTVTPTYVGGAPGLVAGIIQINAQIPATTLPGTVAVQIFSGLIPSPTGVTIAVTQ